jgi:carboxypeptidase C (cathepsin A)
VDEDMKSVGEFMRLFLVKYQRWGSPKFIGGESYGTTRASHLSGWLADNGIALNGVILISSTSLMNQDEDSRTIGFFPSYSAIAWYHKKLGPDLQALPVAQVVAQAEKFADGDYLLALRKGNRLTTAERQRVVDEMARLTGLSKSFIAANDLRVSLARFDHELLRDQGQMVGRLDGRFVGHASDAGAERNDFDPSEASGGTVTSGSAGGATTRAVCCAASGAPAAIAHAMAARRAPRDAAFIGSPPSSPRRDAGPRPCRTSRGRRAAASSTGRRCTSCARPRRGRW